jgi:hypothetical protein
MKSYQTVLIPQHKRKYLDFCVFRSLISSTHKPPEELCEIGVQRLLALSQAPRQGENVPSLNLVGPRVTIVESVGLRRADSTPIAKFDRADALQNALTVERRDAGSAEAASDFIERINPKSVCWF